MNKRMYIIKVLSLSLMLIFPLLGGLLIFALLLLRLGAGMLQLHSIYHQSDSV